MLFKTDKIEIGTTWRGWYLEANFGRWRIERYHCLEREAIRWKVTDREKERRARIERLRNLWQTEPEEYAYVFKTDDERAEVEMLAIEAAESANNGAGGSMTPGSTNAALHGVYEAT